MSASAPCVPCCDTPLNVDVPGIPGADGADGANGADAYTHTTADFSVPGAPGGSVTITVANSLWAVTGQMIVVSGPATFRVTAVPTATTMTLTWEAATGDVAAGTNILSGSGVSPAGVGVITSQSVYAAGTAYSLTNTAARVTFGTTSPILTLTAAGTYLLMAQFRLDYNAATFVADRIITMKLRRTNNTAADLTAASIQLITAIVTTVTQTFDTGFIPVVVYTTANTNDDIEMWGSINTVPSAGSMDVSAASIVALKII